MRTAVFVLVLAAGSLGCGVGLTDLPPPPVRKSAADLSGIWDASLEILLDEIGSGDEPDVLCQGFGKITLRNIDGVVIEDKNTLTVPRCGAVLMEPLAVTRAEVVASDYLFTLSDGELRLTMEFEGVVFVLTGGDLIVAEMTAWEGEKLEIGGRFHDVVAARFQLARRG